MVQWLLNQGIDNPHPYFYPPLPEGRSFAVFSFDFRGHGKSEGDVYSPLYEYLLDARAAYQQAGKLPGAGSTRIAGIGESVGADAVVDTCTRARGKLAVHHLQGKSSRHGNGVSTKDSPEGAGQVIHDWLMETFKQ